MAGNTGFISSTAGLRVVHGLVFGLASHEVRVWQLSEWDSRAWNGPLTPRETLETRLRHPMKQKPYPKP